MGCGGFLLQTIAPCWSRGAPLSSSGVGGVEAEPIPVLGASEYGLDGSAAVRNGKK